MSNLSGMFRDVSEINPIISDERSDAPQPAPLSVAVAYDTKVPPGGPVLPSGDEEIPPYCPPNPSVEAPVATAAAAEIDARAVPARSNQVEQSRPDADAQAERISGAPGFTWHPLEQAAARDAHSFRLGRLLGLFALGTILGTNAIGEASRALDTRLSAWSQSVSSMLRGTLSETADAPLRSGRLDVATILEAPPAPAILTERQPLSSDTIVQGTAETRPGPELASAEVPRTAAVEPKPVMPAPPPLAPAAVAPRKEGPERDLGPAPVRPAPASEDTPRPAFAKPTMLTSNAHPNIPLATSNEDAVVHSTPRSQPATVKPVPPPATQQPSHAPRSAVAPGKKAAPLTGRQSPALATRTEPGDGRPSRQSATAPQRATSPRAAPRAQASADGSRTIGSGAKAETLPKSALGSRYGLRGPNGPPTPKTAEAGPVWQIKWPTPAPNPQWARKAFEARN